MKNKKMKDRLKHKKTDENIQNKLGRSNILTKIISWISGTVAGPIVSFSRKMVLKLL